MITHNTEINHDRNSVFFGGVIVCYLFFSPLYLFKSGLPQPADLIMVIGIGGMLAHMVHQSSFRLGKTGLYGLLFVVYAAFINLINFGFAADSRLLFAIMFYSYNLLAFSLVSFSFITFTRQMQKWSYVAVLMSILAELLFIKFLGPEWGRAEGTFNNPNQLSYWALLCAVILTVLRKKDGLNGLDILALLAVGFIQTQTLSKAGLIVYMLFMIGLMLTPLIRRNMKIAVVIVALMAGLFFVAQPGKLENLISQTRAIDRAIDRLETIGAEQDDSLEGRGYDRLWKFPEYVILGAGEGAYSRFTTSGRNKELHSGLATLLFSYGIPGSILFCIFLYHIFNRKSWYLLLFLALIMAYGATHQNIRFTHFWFFLALVHISPYLVSLDKKRSPQPRLQEA